MSHKSHAFLFLTGLLSILFMAVPYLILGQDAIVTYHDQLDGELIAYLLQARHLFEGDGIPEFMGGAQKTALMPPAPACVLLFLGGNGFAGLVFMQIFGSLFGYSGMYLLVKRFTKDPVISVIMGVLYGYLPFLPVYGLAQYGLPLLLFLVLEAEEGRHRAAAFLYAVFFALNSSLILVGFAVLGIMALWMLARALQKKKSKELKNCFFFWLIMLGIYIVENCGLLVQILGQSGLEGEESLSHKAEYALLSENIFEGFLNAFILGGQHSEDYHAPFVWATIIVFIISLIWINIQKQKRQQIISLLKVIGICFGCNMFFALVSALWNGAPGILVRSHLQAVGSFQMTRFLWLAPCLWYFMFGCVLATVKKLWQPDTIDESMPHNDVMHTNKVLRYTKLSHIAKGIIRIMLTVCMVAALCIVSWKVLLASNLKPNIQKLRNPEYGAISFRDYYAIGVMDQVRDFLDETSGCSVEEYRVVSLGIDPAAALYHGFYCLDGYSNNYSLAHKHAFRKVLTPELKKSEYLTDYFDNWGNRCYLFSAECPGYYTVKKGGFYFKNYELDINALREMGGRYLLSAAYIANAETQGLTLLREEPFETENSYYQIFVYEF